MSDPTSLSLLDRARLSPQDSGWRTLCEIYSPLIHEWLRRYDVNGADADDLCQEVLLAVTKELTKFEHSRRTGAFRNWLRTILMHRVKHYWRTNKRRAVAAGGSAAIEQIDQLTDPESGLSRQWDREHDEVVVARLLQQIRPTVAPQTWEAFSQVVLQQREPSEVAEVLGISVNAVYIAKSRVLRALRREGRGLIE